jgi:hypothetical protein
VEAVILDFYHATEYLAKLAKALHPSDEEKALTQTKAWLRVLRDEGGEVMIALLESWDWPAVRGLAAVRAECGAGLLGQPRASDGRPDG